MESVHQFTPIPNTTKPENETDSEAKTSSEFEVSTNELNLPVGLPKANAWKSLVLFPVLNL